MAAKIKVTQCVIFLLLAIAVSSTLAKPYFWFNQEPAAPPAATEVKNQADYVADKAHQVASDAKDALAGVQKSGEQLPSRIHGHLNQLYSHGSSAVKSVVETVQPDLSNIGKDLTDGFQAAREGVNKKIEPLAHTVKPYIDHAQKVMAPYVNQAKEEVPKLINQAGPALSKVGGQVRDGITGVWDKLKPASQIDGPKVDASSVKDTLKDAGQQVQNTLSQQPKAAA